MLLKSTNILEKLEKGKLRDANTVDILEHVRAIFDAENTKELQIQNALQARNTNNFNNFDIDLLESGKVFHIKTIKKTCIDYRLRFLDTKYFKNDFPKEAISEIKTLEKRHNIKLSGFKVMAPSKLFKLKNPDDPILFAPIGNDYYYLIHKWGNDLHPLRKLLIWPFRTFETLIFTALVLSFIITFTFNASMLANTLESSKFLILFLFMFKSVIGIIIFYAFSQGKNFNTAIWDCKYSK